MREPLREWLLEELVLQKHGAAKRRKGKSRIIVLGSRLHERDEPHPPTIVRSRYRLTARSACRDSGRVGYFLNFVCAAVRRVFEQRTQIPSFGDNYKSPFIILNNRLQPIVRALIISVFLARGAVPNGRKCGS